jgi:multimeric flavodoxin WrbA
VQDWMNEIYEMWMQAHGVMIITPVHWYSPPSVLKLMMDRMVCSDGGNPDPSTSNGKDPETAKKLELKGWRYPKHLAGRRFSVVVHGDAEGVLNVRQAIVSWLADLGLESAGAEATIDRYIGYYEPYATSHEALDRDQAVQDETRRAAEILIRSVKDYRQNLEPTAPDPGLKRSQWKSGSESFGADTDVRAK